nr:hypothetical protein [Micromonospora tarensis]
MGLGQLGAGLHAQLVDEEAAGLGVDPQRGGLLAAAGQGEQVPGHQRLPQRMLGHQGAQVTRGRGEPAEAEFHRGEPLVRE